MKRAILVTNDKGGVGKSTWARGYLEIARRSGKSVAAFDADGAIGTLYDHYAARAGDGQIAAEQDPLSGVGYFSITDDRDQEMLLNALDAGGEIVLIDTPAGALEFFERPLGSSKNLLQEYRAAGYEPIVVTVLDDLEPSARSVLHVMERCGEAARYVIVLNEAQSQYGDFHIFEKVAGERARELGAAIVRMPRLREQTYKRISEAKASFADVTRNGDFTRMDRSAVQYWLVDFANGLKGTAIDP